jgi:hypothetical protein
MTEPINLQVNILQSQEMPRVTQGQKDVGTHQMMGQEMNRAKESEEAPETVQNSDTPQEARLSKDGSGRGRAFQRPRKKAEGEEGGEEDGDAKDAKDGESSDPERGKNVDFMR